MADVAIATVLVAVAIVVERQTQGRLDSWMVVAPWVGAGSFLLLRLGAILGGADRTLGCGFVFAMTWLLPCATLLFVNASTDRRAMVRDSAPFFVALGFFLILIMIVTFERMRLADVARFAKRARLESDVDDAKEDP